MAIRFGLALAVVHCSWSFGAALVSGNPAPDLVARDTSGATVKLLSYRQKKHVALLVGTADRAAGGWTGSQRRLGALDTVLLLIPVSEAEPGSAATILIDRSGIVRRVVKERVLEGTELEHFVGLWQSGKSYFNAYCARCHGEDGGETLCVEKPLTGVGQRLSPEQIVERLRIGEVNEREVVIRGEMIKRFQLEAILVYVGGL